MFKLNKKFIFITVLIVLSISLSACTKNTEGLVAEVNGVGITEEEFNGDFQVFKSLYEKQLGEGALEQVGQDGKTLEITLKDSILEKLIMEKLVSIATEENNITVTAEEVEVQMSEYIAAMGGQENFDLFLSNNQISRDFFEANMKKELLVDKHKEAFLNNTIVSNEESEKYFNDNKEYLVVLQASHILVSSEEEGKQILERLNQGEDFATVATLESLDSISAAQGGELGYFGKGQMITEFEDAAFSLEIGEISDLVKTEVGYHIIYLQDKKDTYEDLKDDITYLLKEDKYLANIQELRDNAKVKKYIETSGE